MPNLFRSFPALLLVLRPLPVAVGVMVCCSVPAAVAQQAGRVLVTGTVRDAAGQALEQAAIGVEGMPGGTNTDDRGRFALNGPYLAGSPG